MGVQLAERPGAWSRAYTEGSGSHVHRGVARRARHRFPSACADDVEGLLPPEREPAASGEVAAHAVGAGTEHGEHHPFAAQQELAHAAATTRFDLGVRDQHRVRWVVHHGVPDERPASRRGLCHQPPTRSPKDAEEESASPEELQRLGIAPRLVVLLRESKAVVEG